MEVVDKRYFKYEVQFYIKSNKSDHYQCKVADVVKSVTTITK